MWHNADFLDVFGSPVRIVSLDTSCRHFDGRQASQAKFIVDGCSSVVSQLAAGETKAIVREFVAKLPNRDREIVNRVFWGGETQTAVAADLGVSKMAVSKAISRIARRGRDSLPPYDRLMIS